MDCALPLTEELMLSTGCLPIALRRPLCGAAAFLLIVTMAGGASGQISTSSWWPKFQRDLLNSGAAPVMGIVQHAHVSWTLRIGDPIERVHYSSPVFSSDNERLYVGGDDSTLTAIEIGAKRIAWTLTLGDGTGIIHQTPTVAESGAIYVGSWDNSPPYDGFCKVLDEGDSARVVWSYPMQRTLASATITPDGLIIVCGKHESLEWGVFGLRDLGDSVQEVWTVATGPQGGSPAVSPDGRWIYVGSDTIEAFRDPIFWQIDASDGTVHESVVLASYVWSASPTISSNGYIFIGEGMTAGDPDPLTEGKVYVFVEGADERIEELCSLALGAGHLNGGIGAMRTTPDGLTRLYVPANGLGRSGATLIAVEFDPKAVCDDPDQPMLRKVWSHPLGPDAFSFPAAVVTHDAVIYTGGPADLSLYAVRDAGDAPLPLWSLALGDITRVEDWQPGNQRGHKEIIPGPDGTLYWLAVDGYLYAIKGWPTGDLDGNGRVNSRDLIWLKRLVPGTLAGPILLPLPNYQLLFPEIDAETVGDIDGNGVLDRVDVELLEAILSAP